MRRDERKIALRYAVYTRRGSLEIAVASAGSCNDHASNKSSLFRKISNAARAIGFVAYIVRMQPATIDPSRRSSAKPILREGAS